MATLASRLRLLGQDRRGVTALEYGLIAAVVVVVGLAGFSTIGNELSGKFTQVNNTMGDSGGEPVSTPDAGNN